MEAGLKFWHIKSVCWNRTARGKDRMTTAVCLSGWADRRAWGHSDKAQVGPRGLRCRNPCPNGLEKSKKDFRWVMLASLEREAPGWGIRALGFHGGRRLENQAGYHGI